LRIEKLFIVKNFLKILGVITFKVENVSIPKKEIKCK